MRDDCRHGQHHFHHHHHHVGLAEGITPQYLHKLKLAMVLAVCYLIIQSVGSILSGSLALLADAGHKVADIGSLALAFFAAWFSNWSTSTRKTFGFYRLEIMAALVNATGLIFIAFFILLEAWQRAIHPSTVEIHGSFMFGAASMGLLVNCLSAWILYPAKTFNLNVKGALLHIMADILNSVGEMAVAVGIMLFHVNWLDTVISVILATFVLYNASRILREALNILMEAAPPHIDVTHVQNFLKALPGVLDVHDLHIWTITTGKEALLAHVKVDDERFSHVTVQAFEKNLRHEFGLCHITLQLEPPHFQEGAILF